ncbi:MAG: hypothetical protein QW304_07765 [Thermoproteota archaeon]
MPGLVATIVTYAGTVNPGTAVGTISNLEGFGQPFIVTGWISLENLTSAITATVTELVKDVAGPARPFIKVNEAVYSGVQTSPQIRVTARLIPGGGGHRITAVTGTPVDILFSVTRIQLDQAP